MSKRLVKIAKEMNVGVSTIVEFLRSNGFEIESKPTAKVSDEMYSALIQEFSNSIEEKEKADKLIIGNRPAKEEEPVVVAPPPPPPVVEPEPEPTPEPEPVVEPEPAPKPKVAAPEPAPEPEVTTTPEPAKEEEKETPAPAAAKKEEPEVIKAEAPKAEVKVVGKIDLDAQKPKKKTKKAETPKVQPKPAAPKAEKPTKKVEAPKVQPKPTAPKTEEVMMRAETPQLKGLKIQGKIDVSKLAPKKKEEKKPAPSGQNQNRRKRKRKKITADVYMRDKRGAPRKPRPRDEVKEVSKKEIEDKIKATMARISGGGKKKRQKIRRGNREVKREKQEMADQIAESKNLQLTEFVSVSELAGLMDVSVSEVITTCMNLGVIVSINQRLDAEIIELVTEEFGHEITFINAEEQVEEEEEIIDDPKDLIPRAPIVTVMGHVDHGKTSLLDYIKSSNVADAEAGGITQHIGAYEVSVNDSKITFLDTPGHEAFTAMRARGAKVTDVAIIIVAADDNVMPQTKEAISHAQAAGVPMVFAINKIDKDGANPERIKEELSQMNILVEDWGGKFQSQEISAKTGEGIENLLEKIQLEAEVLELKANPNRNATGTVIEASLDKGRGYVTKLLVQNGTLKIGSAIAAGEHSGKIKAMFNEKGKRVKTAGPSAPVLVLGLSGAPQAGEKFKEHDTEQDARQIATKRSQISREQTNRASKRISLDEIGRRLALGTFKELNLIIKGDVDGSIEALSDALIKLSVETIQVNVIHKAVGQIIESDVLLASASDAIVLGFQVRPSLGARNLAEKEGVQIKMYSIIYEAIDEIKLAMEGMLEPKEEEKINAQVEIREVYKISKIGTIAGSYVTEGMIKRNSLIRVIREGIVIYPTKQGVVGEISSLKRFKDDAKEVKKGMECGISIKNFNDLKVGDVIEGYEMISIKQTL